MLVENRRKTYPTLIWHVPLGWPLANFSTTHTLPETRIMGLYISRSCFRSARHNTGVWQTDGRTDKRTRCCRKDRASIASRGSKYFILNISHLLFDYSRSVSINCFQPLLSGTHSLLFIIQRTSPITFSSWRFQFLAALYHSHYSTASQDMTCPKSITVCCIRSLDKSNSTPLMLSNEAIIKFKIIISVHTLPFDSRFEVPLPTVGKRTRLAYVW